MIYSKPRITLTAIPTIKERVNEDEDEEGEDEEFDCGMVSPSNQLQAILNMSDTQTRATRSFLKLPNFRKLSDRPDEKEFELNMDINKGMLKRKKASSVHRGRAWYKSEEEHYEQTMIKVVEQNMKLEEEMKKMQNFSEENEQLRQQLTSAKSKLTEQEKQLMNEKDDKINEIADRLNQREEMYKNLLKEFSILK